MPSASMRARTWPSRTASPRSTWSDTSTPGTCARTSTSRYGNSVPVTTTPAATLSRSATATSAAASVTAATAPSAPASAASDPPPAQPASSAPAASTPMTCLCLHVMSRPRVGCVFEGKGSRQRRAVHRQAEHPLRLRERRVRRVVRLHLVDPRLLERQPRVRDVELRGQTLAVAQLRQLVDPLRLLRRTARRRDLRLRPLQLALRLPVLEAQPLAELVELELRLPHLRLRRGHFRAALEALEQRQLHGEADRPIVAPVVAAGEPERARRERLAREVARQRDRRQVRGTRDVDLLLVDRDLLPRRTQRRAPVQQVLRRLRRRQRDRDEVRPRRRLRVQIRRQLDLRVRRQVDQPLQVQHRDVALVPRL